MNAKSPELIDRFIELRAAGATFGDIAAELQVSKPTLIAWSRKHHLRIRNLRALETEARAEQCKISRPACLDNLGEDLRRIREEIARRDLGDIPTARLFLLAARLRNEANRLNGPVHLSDSTGDLGDEENQLLEPSIDWEA